MPVPRSVRRASREGGNISKSPGGSKPVTPKQEPKATSGLFILEVKSATLKENKRGPYRSVTGVAADGKMYWAGLDPSHKPTPGQMITLRGEFKGHTFGKEEKPFHKIENPEVVNITDKSEAPETTAKVSAPDTDGLLETLESLVKQHGIGKILSVLGDLT